jgi:hypothetical protein
MLLQMSLSLEAIFQILGASNLQSAVCPMSHVGFLMEMAQDLVEGQTNSVEAYDFFQVGTMNHLLRVGITTIMLLRKALPIACLSVSYLVQLLQTTRGWSSFSTHLGFYDLSICVNSFVKFMQQPLLIIWFKLVAPWNITTWESGC